MPPWEVDRLTIYQARMLCAKDEEIDDELQVGSQRAVDKWRAKVAEATDVAIDNLMDGKPWHSE